jgi:small ligand-binding sensory domain FIST
VAYLYHSRADTHEEHTVLLVLRAELGHNDVHGCLGGGVQSAVFNIEIVDQFEVGVAAGNGDDLLDLAFHDKRKEEVEKVDVANNIGVE